MSKPTTVRDLIAALQKLDPETHMLTKGYEGGYEDVELPSDADLMRYHRHTNTASYYGPHWDNPNGEHFGIIL